MQGAFYATPILYPVNIIINQFPDKVWIPQIILLNPMAQIIQGLRHSLITDQTVTTSSIVAWPYNLIPYLIVILTLISGAAYFRKNSKDFAEKI
jgi:ABC-2 type transport system permease protein